MKYEDVEQLRDAMIDEMIAPVAAAKEAFFAPLQIALGIAHRGGTYRLAVRVPEMNAVVTAMMDRLRVAAGEELDLRVTGPIIGLQLWRLQRNRPLLIGSSCANRKVHSGTLGCFVRRNDDQTLCILSNNHVLVRNNAIRPNGTPNVGSQMIVDQPSSDDFAGGAQVGELVKAVRLEDEHNGVDAAIARVTDINPPPDRAMITGFGRPLSSITAASSPNQRVHKLGRTTELRTGIVSAQGLKNLSVTIDNIPRAFDQQIEIESVGPNNFSERGDSGSIVFNDDGHPVGLLFGGSADQRFSYANPIDRVLTALGVTIVT